MPQAKTLNARDAKLVQWFTEAYSKEAELEADLTAHISLTEKMSYKKRLRKHLTETRDHKRRVRPRIKQIGGSASASSLPGVPNAVGEVAGKAVAAVEGQVGAARAPSAPRPRPTCATPRGSREEHARARFTRGSRRSQSRWATRRPPSWPRASAATRSAWRSSSAPSWCAWSRTWSKAEIPRDQRAAPRRRSTRRRATAKLHRPQHERSPRPRARRPGARGRRGGSTSRNGASGSRRTTPRARANSRA